jgi:hypothetical protein
MSHNYGNRWTQKFYHLWHVVNRVVLVSKRTDFRVTKPMHERALQNNPQFLLRKWPLDPIKHNNRTFYLYWAVIFLWRIFTNLKNIFSNRKNTVTKFPVFLWKNHHNFLQYEIVLNIVYFHIHQYCKIWLNILMDYHHLSNITKLKTKQNKNTCAQWVGLFWCTSRNSTRRDEIFNRNLLNVSFKCSNLWINLANI